ncbi:unnamed protein product, partial [Effrenium voratum]
MAGDELQPNGYVLLGAVGACGKASYWRHALHLFQESEGSLLLINAALGACERSGQWQVALCLLGSAPDVVGVSCAVGACEKASAWRAALRLFQRQVGRKLRPDVICFGAAISACEKGVQWRLAMDVLSQAQNVGCVNGVVFNSALSACEKAGLWRRSLKLLPLFQEHQPDTVTLNAVLSACEKSSHWLQALRLLRLPFRGLRPDGVSRNAALSACGAAARWAHALQHFDEQVPDLVAWSAAISACARGKQWQLGLMLVHRLRARLPVTDVVYNSALALLEGTEQWQEALDLLGAMSAEGWVPNILNYGIVAGACEKALQARPLAALLREVASRSR